MKHKPITLEQALLYEIATMPSWMLLLCNFQWYNTLLARYNVWKTKRKYALYSVSVERRKNRGEL